MMVISTCRRCGKPICNFGKGAAYVSARGHNVLLCASCMDDFETRFLANMDRNPDKVEVRPLAEDWK